MEGYSRQGTNRYANNLLLGNIAGSGPGDTIQQMNFSSGCSGITLSGTIGTINGSNGATLANTFVNYQNDGTGDYHLQRAIGAGGTICVPGGMTTNHRFWALHNNL